ncbi:MAG: 4-phytase [Pseudonocardiales bacterium]|nr:4-phytase [Pseudonocardiales bacterium]
MVDRDDERLSFLRGPVDRRTALRMMGGAAFAVGGAGFLAACGGSSSSSSSSSSGAAGSLTDTPTKMGGTLTLSVSASQDGGADPLLTFGQVSFYLSSMVFERLVTVDRTKPGFQLSPRLAESWTISDDASTYLIKVRPGVKFHDGTPLTAKDIVFNLRRFISDKSVMKGNLASYYVESGVTALDDQTVQLKLTKPNARLMYVFREWNCSIYPAGTTNFEKCVGTGPFVFKSYNGSQGAAATKNASYWQSGKPYLDEVRVTVIPEATSAIQALSRGQIDAIAANSLSQASVAAARTAKGVQVLRLQNYWFDNVQINPYTKPFDDVRLRQAAALSIDPKVVANQMFQGDAVTAANIPVAPNDPFFPASLKTFGADVQKAKSLLAEAGYANGVDLPLLVSDNAISNPVMQVMANQLESSGIRVKLDTRPAATWTDAGSGWGTGPAWEDGWWLKDPLTMSLYLLSDTPGYRTWGPQWAADAIEQAFVTTDQATQIKIMQPVLEAASLQSGLLIPVIHDGFVPVSSSLRGLDANTFNLDGYFEQIGKA